MKQAVAAQRRKPIRVRGPKKAEREMDDFFFMGVYRLLITSYQSPITWDKGYGGVGRRCGVGRGLGVTLGVGVGVGVGLGVGETEGVGDTVGVGVGGVP